MTYYVLIETNNADGNKMKISKTMDLQELKKVTRRKNIRDDDLELLRENLVESEFSDTNEMTRKQIAIECDYAIARMDEAYNRK